VEQRERFGEDRLLLRDLDFQLVRARSEAAAAANLEDSAVAELEKVLKDCDKEAREAAYCYELEQKTQALMMRDPITADSQPCSSLS
jgi:hypothetical protein